MALSVRSALCYEVHKLWAALAESLQNGSGGGVLVVLRGDSIESGGKEKPKVSNSGIAQGYIK